MKGEAAGATSGNKVPAEAMRCPRCNSANTKFCYYNNYSLSQPRHLCKTCRRYWTRGGALRNVPIGGGCRKSKKLKPSAADVTFFSGLSPAMDFHLSPPMRFPAAGPSWLAGGAIQEIMSTTTTTNNNNSNCNNNIGLASTIESLSCMNQDLHWKLQQQRLSNVNVPEDSSFVAVPLDQQQPKLLEPSRGGDGWFSGNSYADHLTTTAGNDVGTTTVSNWNINYGFGAWSDNHHFSTA